MAKYERQKLLERFQGMKRKRVPIIGGGAGTGISAKGEEAGGIDEWAEAAMQLRQDIIVICHGGPIATPQDAAFMFKTCKHCHGFYGASSLERLPVEAALAEQTRAFKNLRFR
jgi:predicted TIM-barrel enzyme